MACDGSLWAGQNDGGARCLECREGRELTLRLANVPLELAAEFSLSTFVPAFQQVKEARSEAADALGTVVRWSANPDPPFIELAGKPGVGKSHLAVGVTLRLVTGNPWRNCWYTDGTTVEDRFRDFEADEDPREHVMFLQRVPWLVVDDLGSGRLSDYSVPYWEQIIDRRMAARLPTLLTTNFTRDEIADRLGARVVDRLRNKRLNTRVHFIHSQSGRSEIAG